MVYEMLHPGTPAFPAESPSELFTRIRNGRHSPFAPSVDPRAARLVDALLDVRPLERLTASDALAHPWLAAFSVATSGLVEQRVPPKPQVQQSMQQSLL